MSPWAGPAGATAAIVAMSAAEAAATPSLRTMAHPLWFVEMGFRARIMRHTACSNGPFAPNGVFRHVESFDSRYVTSPRLNWQRCARPPERNAASSLATPSLPSP